MNLDLRSMLIMIYNSIKVLSNHSKQFLDAIGWNVEKTVNLELFFLMDLPINDKDLATIVNALALGGDARLYHLLKEVKQVRDDNNL